MTDAKGASAPGFPAESPEIEGLKQLARLHLDGIRRELDNGNVTRAMRCAKACHDRLKEIKKIRESGDG